MKKNVSILVSIALFLGMILPINFSAFAYPTIKTYEAGEYVSSDRPS